MQLVENSDAERKSVILQSVVRNLQEARRCAHARCLAGEEEASAVLGRWRAKRKKASKSSDPYYALSCDRECMNAWGQRGKLRDLENATRKALAKARSCRKSGGSLTDLLSDENGFVREAVITALAQ